MNPLVPRPVEIALRCVIAVVCLLGIWYSWRLARADYLFRKDTESSIRAAIRLVPDGWEYYMRLSQIDRRDARDLLATSLRLDRFNAQADIELGLKYEADGDIGGAERLLLDAYSVDHTYLPRWTLANFYYRQDNMPAFWNWARSAAAMPPGDLMPLFQLCWHVSTDTNTITGELMNDNPDMIRQYLYFLLTKGQRDATIVVAQRLINTGGTEMDHRLVLWTINELITNNNPPAANTLWSLLQQRHWVVPDSTVPYNADFAREPVPVSFDWALPEFDGLHSFPGASGLEVEFSGAQPEDVKVAEQVISLTPGNYNLVYSYRTTDIGTESGIKWVVLDARSNAVLAQSPDLSSDTVTESNLAFTVPAGAPFVRLRLAYQRALGTSRIAGTLVVPSVRVQPHS